MKRIALFIVLLVFSLSSFGQMPTLQTDVNRYVNLKDFIKNAQFSRIVTVDNNYGQFKTIHEAISYINANTVTTLNLCTATLAKCRNWTSPWTIEVFSGPNGNLDPTLSGYNYTETSFVVPDYVSIVGFNNIAQVLNSFNDAPIVNLSATSGSLITLGKYSNLSNLQLRYVGAPTAAIKIIHKNDSSTLSVISNVAIQSTAGNNSFAVDGLVNDVGAIVASNLSINLSSNALGTNVINNDTSQTLSIYNGRFLADSGCAALIKNTSTGSVRLFSVRLDPNCTVDLVNSGGGVIESNATSYRLVTGTVNNGKVHLDYGSSLPGTCSVGESFLETTTPKHCACITSNTWKCITLI